MEPVCILVPAAVRRHHPSMSDRSPGFRPLALAAAITLAGCTTSIAQTEGVSLRGALPSLAPLVKRVVPSVVNIAVTESVGGEAQPAPVLRGAPLEKQFRDRLRSRRDQVQGAGSRLRHRPVGG